MQIKNIIRYHCTPRRIPKIEQQKSDELTRMQSNRNPHTLLWGCKNGTISLEDILAVFYNVKHTFIIWPRNPMPKVIKNMLTQKPLYGYLQ